MPGLDNSNTNEIVLDESSNENYTTSLNPISTLPPSFPEAEEEGDAEGWEAAETPCFQESKADEEKQRIAIDDSEVDHKATFEKWRGAISGLREHNETTPQSLGVQLIEDRIDKAWSDLNFLEQQTMQMETEMKTLQMELAKLKDQLCQTQIQYDE